MEHGPYKLQDDLTLKFSDDGRELLAEFAATDESKQRTSIQLNWFQERLAEHGLDKLRLNKDAIGQCIKQYNDGSNAEVISIGECIDAEFNVKLSNDHMQASLNCTPAQGGELITKKQILNELTRQNISFGINEQAIDAALQTGEAHDVIIAQGQDRKSVV